LPVPRCLIAPLLVLLAASFAFAGDAPMVGFQKHVLPILSKKCIRCHGEKRRGGKLDMRSLKALLKGGVSGPAIVPGKSDKSLMIELIHFNEMPPKKDRGPRVSPKEFELLKSWIDAGASP
jgi:hypothetical protein